MSMMKTVAAVLLAVALSAAAAGQVSFFTTPADFLTFNTDNGYTFDLGTETFEENTMTTSQEWFLDDPLVAGVASGPFPTGLDYDVQIQSNTLGGNATQTSPRGAQGLLAIALGAGYGEVSDIVVSNTTDDSTDLLLPGGGAYRSLSFDAITLYGDPVQIQVYSTLGALIGQTNLAAAAGGEFVGLGVDPSAGVTIGRINLYAPQHDWEGADNIEVYVPEPGTLALLAVAVPVLLHRRR